MFRTKIQTRAAKRSDANDISLVHSESWKNAYAGMLPYKALNKMIQRRNNAWWSKAIRKSSMVLVIEFDDQIAGYATLGKNRVDSLDYSGEIYELYIKPEYQGLGLGTELFLDAQKELLRRGHKKFVVWTLTNNDNANRFYHNAGGQAVAIGNETFDGEKFQKIAYGWN